MRGVRAAAGVAGAATAFVLYLGLRTWRFTPADIRLATALRESLLGPDGAAASPADPHHPLHGILSRLLLGFAGTDPLDAYGLLLASAAVSALLGSLAVWALFSAVARTGGITAAACAAGTFAVTRAQWLAATGPRPQAGSAALVAAALLCVARRPGARGRAALAGAAAGGALLADMTNVLILPALAWGAIAPEGWSGTDARDRRAGRGSASAAFLAALVPVLVAGLLAGATLAGARGPEGLAAWLSPPPGGPASQATPQPACEPPEGGLLAALSVPPRKVGPPWLPPELEPFAPLLAPAYDLLPVHVWTAWVSAAALIAGIPWILLRRRREPGGGTAPAAAGRGDARLTWLMIAVSAGAFLPAWALSGLLARAGEPTSIAPVLLLCSLAGFALGAVFREGLMKPGALYASTFALSLACGLFVANVPAVVLAGVFPEQNEHFRLARSVSLSGHRGDVVFVSGAGTGGLLEAYLPYFEGREVIVARPALAASRREANGLDALREEIDLAVRTPGRSLLVLSEWYDPRTRRALEACTGASAGPIDAILARYDRVERTPRGAEIAVWQLVPRAGTPTGAGAPEAG